MGNWTITIHGRGPHHNQNEGDADKKFQKLIQELEAAGHKIYYASITYGEREEVLEKWG
ncbi:MAG: hypothetical protein AB1768_20805 [Pseudomonadota bacterium]